MRCPLTLHAKQWAPGLGREIAVGCCWCWCRRELELELGWELGRDLHVHHKRGHVHDHGRILRTGEVGGVAGLELGRASGSWSQIRARALLLQWAACPGLLGARGVGRGLEIVGIRFDVRFGVQRVNSALH